MIANSKEQNTIHNLYDTKDSTKSSDEDHSRVRKFSKPKEMKIRIKRKSILSSRKATEDNKSNIINGKIILGNIAVSPKKIRQKLSKN
mmetsp:Transcript_11452/g.12966  ORF Transcript_11452/g.12966 Transcript_11452/m.12966 type:complete len:88 (+) Transcript_11452:33-296(+)